MDEITVAKTYLYGRLSASATLAGLGITVHDAAQVPQSAAVPYVSFNLQAGGARRVVNGPRIFMVFSFLVKAVADIGQPDTAASAREEIETLLDGASGIAVGANGFVYGVHLHTTVEYPEMRGTTGYLHSGGLFEVVAGMLN